MKAIHSKKLLVMGMQVWLTLSLLLPISACKPSVPGSESSLISMLLNIRKLFTFTSEEQSTITVRATLLDTAGNSIGGAKLSISEESSSTSRVALDKTSFTDANGRFAINLKVGVFYVKVESGDGNFLGYFRLSITGVSTPPTVLLALGVTLDGLTASPIGIPIDFSPTAFIVLSDAGFDSIYEGTTRKIGIALAGNTNQNITLTILSDNAVVEVGGTITGGTEENGVTIGGTVSDSAQKTTLTFTKDNYTTYQYLLITSKVDTNNINESVKITISSPQTTDKVLSLVATDKDALNFSATTTIPLFIMEGQTGETQISLNFAPTSNIVVEITTSDSTKLKLNNGILPSIQMTFTPANYSTPQTVTYNAVEDGDKTSDSYFITIRAVDTTKGIQNVAQSVMVADNDVGIIFSNLSPDRAINVNSPYLLEGQTGTFTIKLDTDPGIDRTINLSSNHPSSFSISPATLEFNRSNWNTVQTVTVTALTDINTINESVTVTGSGNGLLNTNLGAIELYDSGNFILDVSPLDNTINLY